MDWSPDTNTISHVLLMLQALRDPTCPSHQEALQTLSTDTTNPAFVLHLIHIFSRGGSYEGIPVDIRQLAGLITKNYVFPRLVELSADVFTLVKAEIVSGLSDPLLTIRSTAGLLVGRITAGFMMSYWGDIMQNLLGGALQLPTDLCDLQSPDSSTAARIDGSLLAVKRICEDSAEKLFMDTEGRPLESLIPQLIAVFASPLPEHRLKAVESINALIYLLPSGGSSSQESGGGTPCALITHMGTFLASLSQMAADPNACIRRAVCQALVLLTCFQVAVLVPMLAEVCQFMLHNISDQDEGVSMEACEFWWEFLKNRESAEYLLLQHDHASSTDLSASVLGALIPALISRFPLSSEQIEFEREEDEATASGEKEVNFKPVHHTTKAASDDNDEEDEGGGEGQGDAGGASLWTLRKQAARVLDLLAYSIPPHLTLSISLPIVQANFNNSDVWVYETGMLTLGALSHGCSDDMAPHLPTLLPALLSSIQGRRELPDGQCQEFPPEVRCISCWVLGRYSEYWFTEGEGEQEYEPRVVKTVTVETQKAIIHTLMASMLDTTPRLQAAACSALTAVFESSAASELDSYDPTFISILDACLTDMVRQFHHAFSLFGVKNSLILCDTIGTLCDSISPNSLQSILTDSDSNLSSLILNPLMQKFSQLLQMQDPCAEGAECAPHPHLYPVMECLTSVSTAVGLDLLPFSTDLVKMLLQLISSVVDAHDKHHASLEQGAAVDSLEELPGIDFAVCSLDVLSSLVEGMKGVFSLVVLGLPLGERALGELPIDPAALQPYCQHGSGDDVQRMLIFQLVRCLSFVHSSDLRQSAFSLVGDLISEGSSAPLFATPLATSLALSFPAVTPRNEVGADFLSEAFMGLCSESPPPDGSGFFLTPCILYIFQLCVYQIDTKSAVAAPLVANNAVWVIGEYCLAIGAGALTDKLILPLACQVTGLLQHIMALDGSSTAAIKAFGQEASHSPLALKQNLAITLGRLAFLSPQVVSRDPSPLLTSAGGACLQSFCKACALIQPSDSRDHAFMGLIALLNVNPQGLLHNPKAIEQFCYACNSWELPPYDSRILMGLREVLLACSSTESWSVVMKALRGGERLHRVFQLQ